jgi:hypothetical protein
MAMGNEEQSGEIISFLLLHLKIDVHPVIGVISV